MKKIIIVLGKAFHPDGSPDSILRGRVEKGIEVYKDNSDSLIIFSGGKAHWQDEMVISEAKVMYNYAKKIFPVLDENRTILEEEGFSTEHQLVKLKKEILLPNQYLDIIIVTDEIHMPRAFMTAEHILGEDFKVAQEASFVDIAGGWRNLIEEREKNALNLILESRIGVIKKGDHETWLKYANQHKSNVQKMKKEGYSPDQILQKLIDKK